jgi:tRNA 2-thiouridine synthesizing protein A
VAEHELDARGLKCPLPVLRTRAFLEKLSEGEELTVRVTDPASVIDFPHFCNTTGHVLIGREEAGGEFVYRIRRRPNP